MAPRKKRPPLDEADVHELLALLSAGCSRRVAAAYVGCSPAAIQSEARGNPQFAEALAHAENQSEILFLQNIRRAASQERYWRAAAWALERRNPQDFGPRPPNTMRAEEVTELMREVATIVFEEVHAARYRKRVLKRVLAIIKSLGLPPDEVFYEVRQARMQDSPQTED